jgi:hypothetical protein
MAFVVLVDGASTVGVYLEPETCLNHVERLSQFVSKDIRIAITVGHTDHIWRGRGQR